MFLIVVFVFSAAVHADDHDDLLEMSLEELVDLQISVASKKETSVKEAPGIITVITRDQIQKSGARDLIDILRLVPGFDVHSEWMGAYGVSVRGIWANEGKVLVLMDGVPLNEDGYFTFQYGHHIPLDIVERIEIMRGPGSAIYGNSAELGVISIITRQPEEKDEVFLSTRYSQMRELFGRKNTTAYYGTKGEDWSFSAFAHFERGNFTDQKAKNYDAWSMLDVDFSEQTNGLVNPGPFVNFGGHWGNLSGRVIIDRYQFDSMWPNDRIYKNIFYSDIYNLQYDLPLSDDVSIISKFTFKKHQPWSYTGASEWKTVTKKTDSDTHLAWDLGGGNNLVFGISYDQTRGKTFNKDILRLNNSSFYFETLLNTDIGNLTVGGRYVDNSYAGTAFVPRIALTNVFDKWHYKLLYTEAYKTPGVFNIDQRNATENPLKSEHTTTMEIELGTELTEHLSFTANVFDTKISDVIVWQYSNGYLNYDRTGSRGIELAIDYKKDIYDIGLTYSWYEAVDNKVPDYSVWDDQGHLDENDALLGTAPHKVSLYASVNPCEDLFITPTVTYYSPRYAINGWTPNGRDGYEYDKLDGSVLMNISILKKNAFGREGLDLSFSIYNLFEEDFMFIPPYISWYGPTPGPSRAFVFAAQYNF